MKTQEEKLQKVMEAAGHFSECWHIWHEVIENRCHKCGVYKNNKTNNPSPDDLNELFRLADKLGWHDVVTGETADGDYFADIINSDAEVRIGNSRSEAFVDALFIATGGEDETHN